MKPVQRLTDHLSVRGKILSRCIFVLPSDIVLKMFRGMYRFGLGRMERQDLRLFFFVPVMQVLPSFVLCTCAA
jgi:hypothetical protein